MIKKTLYNTWKILRTSFVVIFVMLFVLGLYRGFQRDDVYSTIGADPDACEMIYPDGIDDSKNIYNHIQNIRTYESKWEKIITWKWFIRETFGYRSETIITSRLFCSNPDTLPPSSTYDNV